MQNIEFVSYTTSAVLFLALSLVLLTGERRRTHKLLLAVACGMTALAGGAASYRAAYNTLPLGAVEALEVLRNGTWFAFLLSLLLPVYALQQRLRRVVWLGTAIACVFTLAWLLAGLLPDVQGSFAALVIEWGGTAGLMLLAVGGLALIEQVHRGAPPMQRDSMRYMLVGIGALFAYDFFLYSDALLLRQIDTTLWQARGFVHAMVVPLIAFAIVRNKYNIDVFISRKVVFHTTALLGAGIYLLAMGIGGYYVRTQSGSWGPVAQTMFFFGAVLILAILTFSEKLRAQMRVFIAKHFFHYKYDYRDEWLQFIRTLSAGSLETQVRERAVRAVAEIIQSPGGILWVHTESGRYEPVARWHMDDAVPPFEAPDSPLVRFLQEKEWVVNLDQRETEAGHVRGGLNPPTWLTQIENAWLVVPLILHDQLFGFVVLARTPLAGVRRTFNWEDCDLLKIAGRQAASHLGQLETARALAESRQFEAYNRLSTYVVHDIKNLVSQLTLLVANAAKHKANPLFMDDAIRTVESSVARMHRLLAHLRGESSAAPDDTISRINLPVLLREQTALHQGGRPAVTLELLDDDIAVHAGRDRLASVIGHVLQNARDATPADGQIVARLARDGEFAVIGVADTGCGMDERFVRENLFRPFVTTKGSAGMGIGCYETREYIRSLGGEVEVQSRPGCGTTFRLRIPLAETRRHAANYPPLSA